MSVSKRDINTLLIVLGLAILALSYFLPFRGFSAQTETVRAEIAALEPRELELEIHVRNVPAYNSGITLFAQIAAENLTRFPKSIRTEDLVMFVVDLEKEIGMEISSASFTEEQQIAAFDAKTEVGQRAAGRYTAKAMTTKLSFRMGYQQLKDALTRITEDPERTALDSMGASYDATTGTLTGTMDITKAFVDDGTYVYEPTDVPEGNIGVNSPFGTLR
ncbi:hypothetical protein FACS189490_10090 [Clostridia bacterium]|nr:hypothetical protein FACS189490_10090 [Clostridia bacterium]